MLINEVERNVAPEAAAPTASRRLTAAWIRTGLLVMDTFVVLTATVSAISLRASVDMFGDSGDVTTLLYPIALIIVAFWIFTLFAVGAYRHELVGAGTAEYRAVLNGSLLTAGLLGITAYLFQYPLSRAFFFLLFSIGIPLLLLGRLALRRLLHAARRRGYFREPILLAGDEVHMAQIANVLRREQWMGYDIVGVLTYNPDTMSAISTPVLGTPDDVVAAVRATKAGAVIFTEGSFRREHHFNHLARLLEQERSSLFVVPAVTEIASNRMDVRPMAGIPLLTIAKPQASRAGKIVKRGFDIAASILIIIVLSPVLLTTALTVKFHDRGPIIFRQRRVGRSGQLYDCLKFRSMVPNAEELRETLVAQTHDGRGLLFKLKNDPRVTPVGRLIRRYSIDELPQLFNVVKGDMSLVGPRPALESEVAQYKTHVLRRLDVRPGITGLWQVSGRSDLSWDDAVRLDLYYVDNWSFLQDITILIRTVRAVFASTGAY